MNELMESIKSLVRDEEGATAVEYGVMVALIIAVCIAVVLILGEKVNNAFDKVNDKMPAN